VTVRTGKGSTASVSVAENSGAAVSEIVATAGHPFWVPSVGRWVRAGDLQPGQWLRTSSGTWVQVAQVAAWTAQATVHNLTVDGVHTYHVLAGSAPVLVHNCGDARFEVDSAGTATDRTVSPVALNKQIGDACSNRIADDISGSVREVSYKTTTGVRRVDVATPGRGTIESKVGRMNLSKRIRSEVTKDAELLQSGRVRVQNGSSPGVRSLARSGLRRGWQDCY
jgi:hypothetical protein